MKKKLVKKILISIIVLIAILFLSFYIYTLDYYRADKSVDDLIANSNNITTEKNITTIEPTDSNGSGMIFYPGGKVEAKAYIPILEEISEYGITCYLVKMPFNLAVFNKNAASSVIDSNTDIKEWYLAGHSLGGAMASIYSEENYSKLQGLILLAACPLNDAPIDTICVYGSYDKVLDTSDLANRSNVFKIIGGNHAYFGNYGLQKGDGVATIEREMQQEDTINKITEFVFK
jgi:hypothetical protein